MNIMNLSSMRRTFFVLFSVMGLFLVLSCFISTEDYFVKQARIVNNAHGRTTHRLLTDTRATVQSHTLLLTTVRRFGNHTKPADLTTNHSVTAKRGHLFTTAKKLRTKLTDYNTRNIINSTEKYVNKTVYDPSVARGPNRITKETYQKEISFDNQTTFIGRKPNLTDKGEIISLPLSKWKTARKNENMGEANNSVLMSNWEPDGKPVIQKNTFLSVKYKNMDKIREFKNNFLSKREGRKTNQWDIAKSLSLFKHHAMPRHEKDHREYFKALSKRKIRFAKGFHEVDKSVLRRVHWQPHYDVHNYNYLIKPEINCGDHNGGFIDVTLVVFILTSPVHYSNRRVIRNTWMSHAKRERLDMRVVFLLGHADDTVVQHYVKDEAEQYKDILQEDFHDSYVNLTLKTIMGLKWSTQSCPKAKFVMKVDDDVAVNVVDLMTYIETLDADQDFIGGIITRGAAPYRNFVKKWYVPEEVYPDPTYPPYPQGKSYLMTMNVARDLYEASKELEIFPWEDVFIGLCLQEIGLSPSEIEGFNGYQPIFGARRQLWKNNETLKIVQGLLIVFDLTETQMESIWHVWRYGSWPNVAWH